MKGSYKSRWVIVIVVVIAAIAAFWFWQGRKIQKGQFAKSDLQNVKIISGIGDGLLHLGAFVWLGNGQRKTFCNP